MTLVISTIASTLRVSETQALAVAPWTVKLNVIPAGAKVQELMVEHIDRFFATHLSLPQEEAIRLHREYYQTYGLSIEGLVRHHQIDPMEYNSKVDDAIPLDGIIKPSPELKELLADLDRSKVKPWLFTNAYINHARRVVRLLEIEEYFEGVTYCDYSSIPLVCKPHTAMYQKAMKEAGVGKYEDCFFVGENFLEPCPAAVNLAPDDSYGNCKAAQQLGWSTAHLAEETVTPPRMPASKYQIRHLEELRTIFPQFFKSTQT